MASMEETTASIRDSVWQKCCVKYKRPLLVYGINQKVHRFGLSSNLNFSEPIGEQYSYIWGLSIIPVIAGILFLVWTTVCLVLTCLGPSRVGFWSGRTLATAYPPLSGHENNSSAKRCCKPTENHPRRLRMSFLIVSILLLIWVVLLTVFGFHGFKKAVTSGYKSASLLLDSLNSIFPFLEQLIVSLMALQLTATLEVSNALNECVTNLGNGASDITHLKVVYGVNNHIQTSIDSLTSFYQLLFEVNKTSSTAQVALGDVSRNYYFNMMYWIPLVCLTIFLVGYLVFVWRGHFNNQLEFIKSYIVLPLFFLWVTLSWIASLVFFLGALANSDLCSGTGPNGHFSNSPAGTFATLLSTDISNQTETTFLLHLAEYYIGCNGSFPAVMSYQWTFLEDFASNITNITVIQPLQGKDWDKVKTALESAATPTPNKISSDIAVFNVPNFLSQLRTDLSEGISDVRSQLVIECGSDIAQAVIDLWLSAVVILTIIHNFLPNLHTLLQCSTGISPVYEAGVNEAACRHSPVGLGWIMVGLAVVAILGLTLIALRSSLLPVEPQGTVPLGGIGVFEQVDEKNVTEPAELMMGSDSISLIKAIKDDSAKAVQVDDDNSLPPDAVTVAETKKEPILVIEPTDGKVEERDAPSEKLPGKPNGI